MRKLQILICGFVFSLSVFAQTDRGTITGTVSDETGAVTPGAAVEAKNVATGSYIQRAVRKQAITRWRNCLRGRTNFR